MFVTLIESIYYFGKWAAENENKEYPIEILKLPKILTKV